jgi:two-component system NtrC family response regulator
VGVILIVEDHDGMRMAMEKALAKRGHRVLIARGGEEGLDSMRKERPDCLVVDMRLPGMSGLEFLRAMRQIEPEIPALSVTAFGSVETAVEAMKLGSADYLVKPFPLETLVLKVDGLLTAERLARNNEALLAERESGELLGVSRAISDLKAIIRKAAPTDSSVLILGESGTGKELTASMIHRASLRKDRPLVTVNCAALPPTLMESELFGHEKGAFTGAVARHKGRFELAGGGTLFLDEIAEIPRELQAKLLRAIETGSFERVGGEQTIHSDIRLIAATNRDLAEMMAQGGFREDLYFRIKVIEIPMVPLRDRPEDVPVLAEYFLAKHVARLRPGPLRFLPEAVSALVAYPWPGNVRELENVVERAVVLANGETIGEDLLPRVTKGRGGRLSASPSTWRDLQRMEEEILSDALVRAEGNQTKAAAILGIPRTTFQYRLSKLKEGE